MKYKSQLWLSALLVTTAGALFAPERVSAQQAAANTHDQLTLPIALYPDGVVYQKDLGQEPATPSRLVEFNPDASWTALEGADL